MKFVDQIRIHAKAGDGGNGCCSFRREKFVPRGGPDGGDGGRGGDIILQADIHTGSLVSLFYEPLIRAGRGEHGQGKDKQGRSGRAATVKVPVGTRVFRAPPAADAGLEAGGEEQRRKVRSDPRTLSCLADLATPEATLVLCRGGRGGKGNTHFKSSINRVPRQTTDGESGEEEWFILELQTIADAGLVGYPNAGKSTLLTRLSAAQPKVAAYPFTTLHPIVGVVELKEFQRVTVADIPGLIEGAHENRGLGHEFLRHIARCRLLLFVLDMAGSEGRSPIDDFRSLRKELKLHDPLLAKRPFAVLANKMDLPEADARLREFRRAFRRFKTVPISAKEAHGLAEVRDLLCDNLIEGLAADKA